MAPRARLRRGRGAQAGGRPAHPVGAATHGRAARQRDRLARRLEAQELSGRALAIDGFNCLITLETALSGGVVLRGRDHALRDLSSVHGTYRRVLESGEAIDRLARVLVAVEPESVAWVLDRPVSNSGRVRASLLHAAERHGVTWEVSLSDEADAMLVSEGGVVATADAGILDRIGPWVDLPAAALNDGRDAEFFVDLA